MDYSLNFKLLHVWFFSCSFVVGKRAANLFIEAESYFLHI